MAITKYDGDIITTNPNSQPAYLPVPESESAAKRKEGKRRRNPGSQISQAGVS